MTINDSDIRIETFSNGLGVGSIRYIHEPTGTVVEAKGNPIKRVYRAKKHLLKELEQKVKESTNARPRD